MTELLGRFRRWRWLRRRRRLVRAGWRFGTVQELLGLTDEEMAQIETEVQRELAARRETGR